MLKKPITYTNYNGVTVTENFYFNLNKAEILEMEITTNGGLTDRLSDIANAKDSTSIYKAFKDIILKAYGEKTPDGKYFHKSEELSTAFSHTEAYSVLITEFFSDPDAASKFIKGMIEGAVGEAVDNDSTPSLPSATN